MSNSENRKVVIVGGVAGGASCAARLRRLDEHAEILMVERGPYVSYANCGLPYYVGGVIARESSLLVADERTFRELFAIDVGESKARVQSFVKQKSIQYPILLDQDSSVAQKYGIIGVPTIILISRQGEVVSVAHALPDNYKKLLLE